MLLFVGISLVTADDINIISFSVSTNTCFPPSPSSLEAESILHGSMCSLYNIAVQSQEGLVWQFSGWWLSRTISWTDGPRCFKTQHQSIHVISLVHSSSRSADPPLTPDPVVSMASTRTHHHPLNAPHGWGRHPGGPDRYHLPWSTLLLRLLTLPQEVLRQWVLPHVG